MLSESYSQAHGVADLQSLSHIEHRSNTWAAPGQAMADIEIHFTEYFEGDTIVISAQDRELLRAAGLKTDVRTSLAKIARIAVPDGQTTLRFEMPSRNIAASVTVDAGTLKFVTVAFDGKELKVDPVDIESYRREPRGYA